MIESAIPLLKLAKKYAAVIRFILVFLGTYLLLSLFYNLYLQEFSSLTYYPDYLTHLVAVQSEQVVSSLGYQARLRPGYQEGTMHLLIEGEFISRIIEGCNGASVIILFSSFMLAFFGEARSTLFFLLAGAVLLYGTNILRIALMSIGIFEFPQHAHFLHAVAFPLVIYGTVFLLWVLWIRIYSRS